MSDPFAIRADSLHPATPAPEVKCSFTPCARCGELVMDTGSPLEKYLGTKRKCMLCLRAEQGDRGQADEATREIGRRKFLALFGG